MISKPIISGSHSSSIIALLAAFVSDDNVDDGLSVFVSAIISAAFPLLSIGFGNSLSLLITFPDKSSSSALILC